MKDKVVALEGVLRGKDNEIRNMQERVADAEAKAEKEKKKAKDRIA